MKRIKDVEQNPDFKYSVQIPKFLSLEKCDELIEQITTTEEMVPGGVGGEHGEAAIIPEIGGASLARAIPKPKGRAISETTNPENKFLGSVEMKLAFLLFLAIKSIF